MNFSKHVKFISTLLVGNLIVSNIYANYTMPPLVFYGNTSSPPTLDISQINNMSQLLQQNSYRDYGFANMSNISPSIVSSATNCTTPNPIEIANGEKLHEEPIFTTGWEMPLSYSSFYHSKDKDIKFNILQSNISYTLKSGWQNNFGTMMYPTGLSPNNRKVRLARALPNGQMSFAEYRDPGKLSQPFTNLDGSVETYEVYSGGLSALDIGILRSRKNMHGIGWEEFKNNGTEIIHTNGKKIKIKNIDSFTTQVIDPANNIYTYIYNDKKDLVKIIYPDNLGSKSFHYGENAAGEKKLTGISINDKRYTTYLYTGDKATQSGRSNGTQTYSLNYGNNYTIVTNPLGAISKYIYTDNTKSKLSRIERSGVNNCPDSSSTVTYDNNGYIKSKVDWNNIETFYTHDSDGRLLEEKNIDKTIKYYWLNSPSLLSKIEILENNNAIQEISYNYYSQNEPAKNRIKSITSCSKLGTSNCSVTGYGYTLHNNGMLKNISIVKNSKSISYTYDDIGNLIEQVNSAGHTIKYSDYDDLGNVGKIIDPNGMIIEFVYDARSRIISKRNTISENNTRIENYKYGPFGITQIEKDGMRETINYDDFGNISNITHGVGDQVISGQFYTYSNLGKLLTVEYREGNNIRFSQSVSHNQLGWTTASKGNNNQNVRYEYDANGNIIKKTDSSKKVTRYIYDKYNNMSEEHRPDGSTIGSIYDQSGNVAFVRDGNGNITRYSYDGFGNLLSISSPDTGNSFYEYDLNGNILKLTRSNGVTTTYSYDSLNRRTKAITGTSVQTWIYDQCTNGIGRLCGTSDGVTAKGYEYTKDGKISVQATSINGVSYPIYWTYDSYGRLESESRQNESYKVTYSYDALSRVNSVKIKIDGVEHTVVSGIEYEPYGGIKNWTYGNGLTRVANYDTNYRLTSLNNLSYSYDVNNLIREIDDRTKPQDLTIYEHDDIGQLVLSSAFSENFELSEVWHFDKNSNRTKSTSNNQYTFYQTNSGNKLSNTTNIEPKSFIYDDLGNITQKTGHGGNLNFTYDGFNRLNTVNDNSTITTYDYDAFNLRSRKSSNAGSVNYVHSPDGRLVAETDLATTQNGSLNTVYIWLGGNIIGMVRGNQLNYVHNDHLGRPHKLTNSNKDVVWESRHTSYDSYVIQSNIGQFNIGFPGQYYDAESNLWYNWNRYYDATTGRYTQSDPVGLAGGTNTYAYVGNNPISFVDYQGQWGIPGAIYGAIAGGIGGGITGGWQGVLVGAATGAAVGALMPTSSHAVGAAAGAAIGSGVASLAGQATGNIVQNRDVMAMENYNFYAAGGAMVGGAAGGPVNHVLSRFGTRVNMIGKPLGTRGYNRTPGMFAGAVFEGTVVGSSEFIGGGLKPNDIQVGCAP